MNNTFWLYAYAVSCVACLAHVWWHLYKIADTRGSVVLACVFACVPVLNVVIVSSVYYAVYLHVPLSEWLATPLRRKP